MDDAQLLPVSARGALERARAEKMSYAVRFYACPGENRRLLVVLGEAHLKLAHASALGKEVVSRFELRGVETFQRRRVVAGGVLWLLIHVPRWILRTLSGGLVKDSTITDAKPSGCSRTIPGPLQPSS